MKLWPFVLKSTFDQVKVENFTLRDALRAANAELRQHRMLIAGMRSGAIDVVEKLGKMSQGKK